MNVVGMKPLAYYTGSFLADFLLFTLPTIGFIILLFPLNIQYFIMNGSWAVLLAVMVTFGFSLINVTYLFSFMFKSANQAFKQIGLIYLFGGSIIPSFVGGLLAGLTQSTETYKVFRYIFLFDPFWNFADGMNYNMIRNFVREITPDEKTYQSSMAEIDKLYICGPIMAICINSALGVIFFIISVWIDSRVQNSYRTQDARAPTLFPRYLDADNDVIREAQQVAADQSNSD